jgi:ribosomal protein L16 Arg81 hydroxylase
MSKAEFGLGWLVHPVRPEVFTAKYWERYPLVVKRRQPSYHSDLLEFCDVEELLSGAEKREDFVRCVKKGEAVPLEAGTGIEKPLAAFRDGATIVLQGLQRARSTLSSLSNALGSEFSCEFQINAYLTPSSGGETQGLGIHYDTHDVFVLQLAGVKRWRIYESPVRLPLDTQPHHPLAKDRGKCSLQCDLRPGDCLYIPRGFYHSAKVLKNSQASLHLTIGVHPVKWSDLIQAVLRRAARQDVQLRQSLPFAFARNPVLTPAIRRGLLDRLNALTKPKHLKAALAEVSGDLIDRQYPVLNGHLQDLDACLKLKMTTRLARRPAIAVKTTREQGKIKLHFHGKVVSLPSYLAGVLAFIQRMPAFSAKELPASLSGREKLLLLRRLLQEGYLTLAK